MTHEQRVVTYKVLLGIVLTILLSVTGALWSSLDTNIRDARADIKQLQDKKLDKTEHYQDMAEIRDYMKEIRQSLHEHEAASQKRSAGQ